MNRGFCVLLLALTLTACSPAVSAPIPAPAPPPAAPQHAVATSTPPPAPVMPCGATARACVSLSQRLAWLLEGGQVVHGPVPTMPGGPADPTPVGTWRVDRKNKVYRSRQYNLPMPNSVFFYPGVAFHEGSLTEYSHGCLHLSKEDSERFFAALQRGDEVQVVA
ncbi:L,D-transpeptidase [Amycolatopsis sp. NPDC059657]|uniref:L,D-transpeptidase n=1 Tax=Amycolatopsis sp. NPDC059657 TaxID=3346899 RepID=UPI003672236B